MLGAGQLDPPFHTGPRRPAAAARAFVRSLLPLRQLQQSPRLKTPQPRPTASLSSTGSARSSATSAAFLTSSGTSLQRRFFSARSSSSTMPSSGARVVAHASVVEKLACAPVHGLSVFLRAGGRPDVEQDVRLQRRRGGARPDAWPPRKRPGARPGDARRRARGGRA